MSVVVVVVGVDGVQGWCGGWGGWVDGVNGWAGWLGWMGWVRIDGGKGGVDWGKAMTRQHDDANNDDNPGSNVPRVKIYLAVYKCDCH